MNKEKINDFVNVWAQTVGLTEKRYINVIKSDIAKRCEMYEKEVPSISIKEDDCDAYIIKPVNGAYSLEDFLLNRLMLGLREIDFTGSIEGSNGDYIAQDKSLSVNIGLLNTDIDKNSAIIEGLKGKNVQIIKKTIEHELGHCFKSSFTDGYKAPLGKGREQDITYEEMISNLRSYENGKYANQIKTVQELNHEGESSVIKTGVHDAKASYQNDYRVELIDELLNETEALELANINEAQVGLALKDEKGKRASSGNYVNIYNYMTGYRNFTGYGSILKSLLGKEDSFHAEYISSVDIFNKFDEEYADIVQEVWGLNPKQVPPMKCIFMDFEDLLIEEPFNEEIILKLDEFFAKCYEKKVDKIMSQDSETVNQEFTKTTLKEIEAFQARLTTNNNPQKREQLAHNVVFNNIKTRVNELLIQKNQPEVNGDSQIPEQKNTQKGVQQVKNKDADNPKMKFVKGFIQAYNDTEEEYQYEKRANDDLMDIKRVQDIIETNGMSRNLTWDLEGKWIDTPGEDGLKVQYSQKQVSAMARLLKVSQLITKSKKLNPEGRNYLEEFTNLPDIEDKLQQMKKDLKDENSYMYELKQKARENRAKGDIPSYPPTQAEIEAEETPPSTLGQGLKQEMGMSRAQEEKLKQEQEDKLRKEKEKMARTEKEEQIEEQNEKTTQGKKLGITEVKTAVKQGKVTTSETQKSTKKIEDIYEIKRLQLSRKMGKQLTEEQQRQVEGYEKQSKLREQQHKAQNKNKGMSR